MNKSINFIADHIEKESVFRGRFTSCKPKTASSLATIARSMFRGLKMRCWTSRSLYKHLSEIVVASCSGTVLLPVEQVDCTRWTELWGRRTSEFSCLTFEPSAWRMTTGQSKMFQQDKHLNTHKSWLWRGENRLTWNVWNGISRFLRPTPSSCNDINSYLETFQCSHSLYSLLGRKKKVEHFTWKLNVVKLEVNNKCLWSLMVWIPVVSGTASSVKVVANQSCRSYCCGDPI